VLIVGHVTVQTSWRVLQMQTNETHC
jgi:hypothetical protein